jgi:hypothetical protein
MAEHLRHLRQAQLRVRGEAHLQAEERGDDPINDSPDFWGALGGDEGRLLQVRFHRVLLSQASTLRGVGRPTSGLNAELFCVLRVQPLPAELHRLAANDTADRRSADKVIQNIQTNVPAGSTH